MRRRVQTRSAGGSGQAPGRSGLAGVSRRVLAGSAGSAGRQVPAGWPRQVVRRRAQTSSAGRSGQASGGSGLAGVGRRVWAGSASGCGQAGPPVWVGTPGQAAQVGPSRRQVYAAGRCGLAVPGRRCRRVWVGGSRQACRGRQRWQVAQAGLEGGYGQAGPGWQHRDKCRRRTSVGSGLAGVGRHVWAGVRLAGVGGQVLAGGAGRSGQTYLGSQWLAGSAGGSGRRVWAVRPR